MDEGKEQLVRNNLTRQVRCLSIDKDQIRRLLQLLQERCGAARDIELANLKQLDHSDEEFQKIKETIKEAFVARMTINSTDGQQLIGPVEDIIDSANFPESLNSLFIGSDSILEGAFNYSPRNMFHVFFDFSTPKILDFSLMPSQATPNGSLIKVSGYDATWTHGVFSELGNFVQENASRLTWIHKDGVYDLAAWLFVVPFGFWLCYRLSSLVDVLFGSFSVFVQSAAYVYIFFAVLMGFRLLFHYARWVCPLVEYRSKRNKSLRHRVVLCTILLTIVSSCIYDIVKALF